MYARSTTFQTQPGSIEEGIGYVADEVMPAITAMDGCIGLSMLVNHDSGRCIITSAWDDVASMHASEGAVKPFRDRGRELFGGDPSVEEWEIALMHREHRTGASTYARCTWLSVEPARADEAVAFFRSAVLPALEDVDGFCSASLMVNRDTGQAVASVTWDSPQALAASRKRAAALRGSVADAIDGRIDNVEEFELALAHLRVPELV